MENENEKPLKYRNHIAHVKAIKLYCVPPYFWAKISIELKEEIRRLKDCLTALENNWNDHIHIQPEYEGTIDMGMEINIQDEKAHKKKYPEMEGDDEDECEIDIKKLIEVIGKKRGSLKKKPAKRSKKAPQSTESS